AWNNIVNINKTTVDFDAHRILTLASTRINTVYLEGDGFSMDLALPEKIVNQNYTLTIEDNVLWISVNDVSYSKRLLTSDVTGSLSSGVSTISNVNGGILIT
ncbi:MAG: hypothetical protein KAS04_02165, partial [Candidatus Aenigmarchaeota archaeon]|nr:hypothetical protein [Candidatus Aenigmarchaeota archaeon]